MRGTPLTIGQILAFNPFISFSGKVVVCDEKHVCQPWPPTWQTGKQLAPLCHQATAEVLSPFQRTAKLINANGERRVSKHE
jgi:hypothetical protein